MGQIRLGQGLLIVCCLFYLIWWCVAFHPAHGDSHMSGIDGILLLITAVFGLSGLAVNLMGVMTGRTEGGFVSGFVITVAGASAYAVLMFITGRLMHRAVTTELLLIIGWMMLEVASLNAAAASEFIDGSRLALMLFSVLAAGILSLVFYMLYYSVSPMTGYFFGMVPLITEAACMIMFEVFTTTQ